MEACNRSSDVAVERYTRSETGRCTLGFDNVHAEAEAFKNQLLAQIDDIHERGVELLREKTTPTKRFVSKALASISRIRDRLSRPSG